MQDIHPDTCTHHIYIEKNVKPIRQPQRRMNPMIKEIMKEVLDNVFNDIKYKYIEMCKIQSFIPLQSRGYHTLCR